MNSPNKKTQTVITPLMRCVSTFDGLRTSAAGYKAAHKRYNQSKKGKERYRRYEANHPGHWRAKNAVSHAIRAGKLPRADSLLCMNCFEQAKDYHHPNYEPEHWLDVIPVCKKCHRKIHKIA